MTGVTRTLHMDVIRGKFAIVTGATSGIGRATAEGLAARGAEVLIVSRDEGRGIEAVNEIRNKHPHAKITFQKLDLSSQPQIRAFAKKYKASKKPLHILVANSGAIIPSKRLTEDSVPLSCQVNYLGHYTLTRLLEHELITSAPSRIVSVSSATHRYAAIPSTNKFLSERAHYPETKLAQVFFTYEAQRRLGPLGVQACAVDPGGVASNVWKGDYAKPPFSWYINSFLAPSEDGAEAVLHAATVDLRLEDRASTSCVVHGQDKNLRFYAKGCYAAPFLTRLPAPSGSQPALDSIKKFLVKAAIGVASFFDYPVRKGSHGRFLTKVVRAPSTASSYDKVIAKELWEQSARIARVPAKPRPD